MKNFNNSWRKFLNEGSRTENAPFEDTRIRIKLENKQNLLREVTDEEFEHIHKAIEELSYEQLAFHDIFGDKSRLILDFPTPDESTPLGRFINMWATMHYDVNWQKGMVSGDRIFKDTSPAGFAADIVGHGGGRVKIKKINMKIGKWFSKLHSYTLKHNMLRKKIKEFVYGQTDDDGNPIWTDEGRQRAEERGGPRITGNDIINALGEDVATNYYRLHDYIEMMIGGFPSLTIGMREQLKPLEDPEHIAQFITYWRDNAAGIKKNINEATSNRYSIIVTRDPVDVWRMADFDNMSSCHSPPSRGGGSEYYKCAVAEAHGHGAVAYIVETEELLTNTAAETVEEAEDDIQSGEVFGDTARFGGAGFDIIPHARLRLRQVRYFLPDEQAALKKRPPTIGDMPDPETHSEEEIKAWLANAVRDGGLDHNIGVQLAVPERRVYGAAIPGFRERILQWAREVQQTEMQQAPRVDDGTTLNLSDFIVFGGSYHDNPISKLIADLFEGEIEGTKGYVEQDTETEDTLDVDLVQGLVARYQAECDIYIREWNNRMRWTKIDGVATDDGGDGAYITIDAITYANWNEDEWEGMPGVEVIGHGLEELKDYGMPWVEADYPFTIQKKDGGRVWQLPISVINERLVSRAAQEYAWTPDDFEEWCSAIDEEVDDKHEAIQSILTNFFKREGYMQGGAVMKLGRDVMNDDTGLYHWEAEAEEGYEMDEYEFIQFTAHPEIWYKDLGATEEQAMKIMNDRNFWLEIRRRMAAPAFQNTGGEMYPQMPLDMDMFGTDGTEGESQELNLYFSVYGEDPDEQVNVLKELVNLWDDQDEINRVASEVFRDMLAGNVGMDGAPVGDQHSAGVEAPIRESYEREELNILRVERMLAKL
jgi:hypothetical protein